MEQVQQRSTKKITFDLDLKKVFNAVLKRAIDIFFSLFGLLVLAPFFLYLAVRIKREDPGPVFYRGERVGMGGKVFKILKFRTMYETPHSYNGSCITATGDERVTPLGRWLRETKLNELPQLWNVLVGEMSLVGPRPEAPEIVAGMPEEHRKLILSIRPGITSPTSVAYHDEEHRLKVDDVMGDYLRLLPDKMRMDRLYVQHHNIISDFDTIFWTLILRVPRLGGQKIQESWLYDGPIARFIRFYLMWFAVDFLVSMVGVGVVGVAWRLREPLHMGFDHALVMAVVLALSFGITNTVLGIKTVSWSRASALDVAKLIISCSVVAAVYVSIHMVSPFGPNLQPSFIIMVAVVVLAGFVVARYRLRLLTGLATRWINLRGGSTGAGERVLVIGSGSAGEFTTWMLRSTDFRPFFQVVGYVDDDPLKQGMKFDGIRVLGTTADIEALARRHQVGMLFYAINRITPQDRERILSTCKKTDLPLVIIPEVINNVRGLFLESLKRAEAL